MPRMTATERPVLSRTAPVRAPARPRAKKAAPPIDRLSARRLFFRRVRRSLRPGVWFLAMSFVCVLVAQVFHAHPALPSLPTVSAPRFGLASFAADIGFRVHNIEIEGAPEADQAGLVAASGLQLGMPSLGISLSNVQSRIAAYGPVESATVRRVWPGTIVISVKDRAALAIWQQSANPVSFVLIDKSGNVIAGQDALAAKKRDPSLLLLSGTGAPQSSALLLQELQNLPSLSSRVAAAQRVDDLRWNLILKNQTVVKLPVQNENGAMVQLASLQDSMKLLDRPVEVIDLRLPNRLVVRPYNTPMHTADNGDHK